MLLTKKGVTMYHVRAQFVTGSLLIFAKKIFVELKQLHEIGPLWICKCIAVISFIF